MEKGSGRHTRRGAAGDGWIVLLGGLLALAGCVSAPPSPTAVPRPSPTPVTATPPPPTVLPPSPSPAAATPTATPRAGGIDPWGIAELYPTVPSGEVWFMDMTDPRHDPRFAAFMSAGSALTRNADGSWKLAFGARAPANPTEGVCCANEVRLSAYTSQGYHCTGCLYNQVALAAQGYMQDARDWKNVEMTGYVRLNDTPAETGTGTHFVWYNRGGRHITSNGCEGVGYKGALGFDGSSTFDKEQWHAGGYAGSPANHPTGSLRSRWVGFKYVVYNILQAGQPAVKMELWLDDQADNHWASIHERIDPAGWGNQGTHCGGVPDQLITWGGPIATFRWDIATDVDFKDLSVREITPTAP